MGLKFDRFTWAVVAIVALLLVGAVVTVNFNQRVGTLDYLVEDSPTTPVYNAFVAFQKDDIPKAREQYSQQVLEDNSTQEGYGPLGTSRYQDTNASRRLRITKVVMDEVDPELAYVTYALDTYNRGGPFSSGSTWSSYATVEIIREEGAWKINSFEFFY